MKSLPLTLVVGAVLVALRSFAQEPVDINQAARAHDASIAVHRSFMQKVFGMNVNYSGALVPRSKLRGFPYTAQTQPRTEPFDNVSIHPLTGRAEGVVLFSINF